MAFALGCRRRHARSVHGARVLRDFYIEIGAVHSSDARPGRACWPTGVLTWADRLAQPRASRQVGPRPVNGAGDTPRSQPRRTRPAMVPQVPVPRHARRPWWPARWAPPFRVVPGSAWSASVRDDRSRRMTLGSSKTMRAWVVRQPGPIENNPLSYVERPVPAPAPGELLVQVLACGVCRTDLHVSRG